VNRRQALRTIGKLSASAAFAGPLLDASGEGKAAKGPKLQPERRTPTAHNPVANQPTNFDPESTRLLEELRERASHFFLEQADPSTGLVYDRARADGSATLRTQPLASIAATGFGLSALSIAISHGYLPEDQCAQRIMLTLQVAANKIPHKNGFLPHYLNARTFEVLSPQEFSSIDTSLFLAGALHAARGMNSARADALVKKIYDRVDWRWMTNHEETLTMGWEPGRGFQTVRWNSYSECLLMYLLAIGSSTHPIPASSWDAVTRNTYDFGGIRFISSFGALFIHQYPHIWLDLRSTRDHYANYFQNSIAAMRAHKTWCMLQHGRFDWVDERIWGFSASDNPRGSYSAWGAPPVVGDWDGTLSPHAAAGGLVLLPEECIVALKTFRTLYPRSWERYGFVNAFNPGSPDGGWYDPDIISIDLGLGMLMVENLLTGSVWAACRQIPELARSMKAVGFIPA